LMCDSLYLKSNGEMPCWDDVGEDHVLRVITEEESERGFEDDLFGFQQLLHIRQSFLNGRLPFGELCSRCAVREHGVADSLHPKTIRVLHIEPTFLCQLDCPQCIAPKLRKQLKKSPYFLSPSLFSGVLQQLHREGIEDIRLVHFEGRGDPLLHKQLGQMVETTKRYFPHAYTVATSHGNYPFKPYMIDCGLDLLRLSIDGAYPESYARYRIGGTLEHALRLIREIQNAQNEPSRQGRSQLQIEWKYILFEWNDSDDEIREAQRLADELEVHLRFCLTHTAGRSRRFTDVQRLSSALRDLAPKATTDVTFQLKQDGSEANVDVVKAEHFHGLRLKALAHFRDSKGQKAMAELRRALSFDPGIAIEILEPSAHPIADNLVQILTDAKDPATLSDLANIAEATGDLPSAEHLFRRYLECDPPDRVQVQTRLFELVAENCLKQSLWDCEMAGSRRLLRAERAVLLEADLMSEASLLQRRGKPAEDWQSDLQTAISALAEGPIGALGVLGRLRLAMGDIEVAEVLLRKAVDPAAIGPAANAPHRIPSRHRDVSEVLVHWLLACCLRRFKDGEIDEGELDLQLGLGAILEPEVAVAIGLPRTSDVDQILGETSPIIVLDLALIALECNRWSMAEALLKWYFDRFGDDERSGALDELVNFVVCDRLGQTLCSALQDRVQLERVRTAERALTAFEPGLPTSVRSSMSLLVYAYLRFLGGDPTTAAASISRYQILAADSTDHASLVLLQKALSDDSIEHRGENQPSRAISKHRRWLSWVRQWY